LCFLRLPPPRQLGSGMFLILREIYRTSSKDSADARARFRIEVDDCAADAEVVVEEDEKEKVARVIFESEKPRQQWSAPRAYFEKALSRVAGSDIFDPTPRETTWRRFPRFLPVWALAGISLIALAAGIVGIVSLVLSPFNPAGALVVGFFVLAASTLLLKAHRRCSHCGTALCQFLVELDRRFGKKSGDDVATFSIVGRLYRATATLRLEDVEGGRLATLHLQYPEAALSDSHHQPDC